MRRDDHELRPAKTRNGVRIGIAAGAAMAVLVGGAALYGFLRTPAAPGSTRAAAMGVRPDKEGVEWDHAELGKHLNAKGVTCQWKNANSGLAWGPAVYLYATDFEEPNRVYCQKRKSPQDAKDAAGAEGAGAFAWGSFYFQCDDAARLKQIRAALE